MDPIVFTMYLGLLGNENRPLVYAFRKVLDGSGECYNWDDFADGCRYWRTVLGREYKGNNYELEQAWRSFSELKLSAFMDKYSNERK